MCYKAIRQKVVLFLYPRLMKKKKSIMAYTLNGFVLLVCCRYPERVYLRNAAGVGVVSFSCLIKE